MGDALPKKRTIKYSGSLTKRLTDSKGKSKKDLTVSLTQFLVDGSDLEFRELVADLFAAVAGMHALRRALAASVGLSAAEYSVILATWHLQKKGATGINTIAKQLHVAAANITSEVGKLCGKGLLQKKQDLSDTRAVIVELTNSGKDILSQLTPLLREINDRLFSGNKGSDVAVLSRFLRHLADEVPYSIRVAKTFTLQSAIEKRKWK
jgi:DNA-binding MarR family transcriptional regulator